MKIAAYLLVYLGVPVLASIIRNETVSTVLGIVYILLLVPFGILRTIDYYRTNDGQTLIARLFNAVFRVPLTLFGLVCLVAGISIIGWVLYNVFVERQRDYTGPQIIFGFGSFGVGVPLVLYGWYTLRSVVSRKRESTLTIEQQEELDRVRGEEEHFNDSTDNRDFANRQQPTRTSNNTSLPRRERQS